MNSVIPIGSMIIPNRQPEAPLISAILEFDAEIDNEVLVKERQATLKNGSSIMYDTYCI
jgi:arginine deiminase